MNEPGAKVSGFILFIRDFRYIDLSSLDAFERALNSRRMNMGRKREKKQSRRAIDTLGRRMGGRDYRTVRSLCKQDTSLVVRSTTIRNKERPKGYTVKILLPYRWSWEGEVARIVTDRLSDLFSSLLFPFRILYG